LVDAIEVVSLIGWLHVEVLTSGGELSVLYELMVKLLSPFTHVTIFNIQNNFYDLINNAKENQTL
jgi:hypothetical protein